DLLRRLDRMHAFALSCTWDQGPVTLSIQTDGEEVARAVTRHHQQSTFFEFRDFEGDLLGYADTLVPQRDATARVRALDGSSVATVVLRAPSSEPPGQASDSDQEGGAGSGMAARAGGPGSGAQGSASSSSAPGNGAQGSASSSSAVGSGPPRAPGSLRLSA